MEPYYDGRDPFFIVNNDELEALRATPGSPIESTLLAAGEIPFEGKIGRVRIDPDQSDRLTMQMLPDDAYWEGIKVVELTLSPQGLEQLYLAGMIAGGDSGREYFIRNEIRTRQ